MNRRVGIGRSSGFYLRWNWTTLEQNKKRGLEIVNGSL